MGSRQSFINVYIQGTECTGVVESQVNNTFQVKGDVISGFKAFSESAGGNIKDVKLIANSIISGAHERLVWTKQFSGIYLYQLETWEADEDNNHLTLTALATIVYPYIDSAYLDDNTWVYKPIYNDGEFVVSGGGGSTIDPTPADSIFL